MNDQPNTPLPENLQRLASVREMVACGTYRPSAVRIADAILVRVGAIALEREVSASDGHGRPPAAGARPSA